jgi:murein DD-endopeptidase MepM/ murein hydrolase activator NlpD
MRGANPKIIGHAIAALAFSLLLAACESPAPRDTNFQWNLQSDHPAHHAHAHSTYTASNSPITPRRKPTPGWYHEQAPQTTSSTTTSGPIYAGNGMFQWPLQGRILSDYGTDSTGERNDGINISATYGTPIHAAAAGTVTYAGNELKGYGNLVLIRHDDGYVTAYAHAQNIIVSRGDAVSRGQVIGYAGDTGDVTSPQLHFEIRHEMAPVNPHTLLATARDRVSS